MKKSISLTLSMVMALSLVLTACGEQHVHTYGTEWKSNATAHWHEATCEGHETEKSDIDGHSDSDKDGKCNVCQYVMCEHTFDETYYDYDETNHWFNATCGCDVKKDETAHTLDEMGVCEVCFAQVGEPDVSTIEKALAIAETQSYLVEESSIEEESYGEVMYCSFSFNGDWVLMNVDGMKLWASIVEGEDENGDPVDEVFAIYENYGEPTKYNYELPVEIMNGYLFNLMPYFYQDSVFYGANDLLGSLYEIASEGVGFEESVPSEGNESYAFSAAVPVMDMETQDDPDNAGQTIEVEVLARYVTIDVAFTLGAEYIVETASVELSYYAGYDVTETDGVYTVNEGAEVTQSVAWEIQQSTEEDTTNPYAPEKLQADSFDLVDEDGNVVGDKLTVEKSGSATSLYIENVLPVRANLTIDVPNAYSTTEGLEVEWMSYSSYVMIKTHQAELGTYTVVVETANVTKTFEVEIVPAELTSFEAQVLGTEEEIDWWGDTYLHPVWVTATESVSVFEGANAVFNIAVNTGADARYTYEVATTDGDKTSVSLTETTATVDVQDEYGWELDVETAAIAFKATVAGTYTVTFTSTANSEFTATITFVVKAAPNVAEILNGTYTATAEDTTFTATFTPASEGATNGTLTLTDGTYTDTYTYSYADGVLTTTLTDDALEVTVYLYGYYACDVISFNINDNYEVEFYYAYTAWASENTVVMTKAGNEEGGNGFELGKTYDVTLVWDESSTAAIATLDVTGLTSGEYTIAVTVSRANYSASITGMFSPMNRFMLDANNSFTYTITYNAMMDGTNLSFMSSTEFTFQVTITAVTAA